MIINFLFHFAIEIKIDKEKLINWRKNIERSNREFRESISNN